VLVVAAVLAAVRSLVLVLVPAAGPAGGLVHLAKWGTGFETLETHAFQLSVVHLQHGSTDSVRSPGGSPW